MMMATGFGAPLTGAGRGPNRRDSWSLRLKEGRGARKRAGWPAANGPKEGKPPEAAFDPIKKDGSRQKRRTALARRMVARNAAETDEADQHHGPSRRLRDRRRGRAAGRDQQGARRLASRIEQSECVNVFVARRG